VRIRGTGRGDDLGLAGVGTSVAEILADGAVEEVVILPDVADAAAELDLKARFFSKP